MLDPSHFTELIVPGAPPIASLRFRPCLGEPDYPAIVQLYMACKDFDQIDPLSAWEGMPSLEQLSAGRSAYIASDSANDMLIAEIDGQVIGYNTVDWWMETDNTCVYLHRGCVLPQWRGKGIGTAMLEWMERRIGEIALAHGVQATSAYAANSSSTQKDWTALLTAQGYTQIGGMLEMEAVGLNNVADAPFPLGIAQVPVLNEHASSIYDSYVDAYAEYTEISSKTDEDRRIFIDRILTDPSMWVVAWDGDQVVGQVGVGIRQGIGVIREVSVRKPWRNRGIGKALLTMGMRRLNERGVTEARLCTRAANPFGAINLYQTTGFQPLKEFGWYRKPVQV